MRHHLILLFLLCMASMLMAPVMAAASPEKVASMYDSGKSLVFVFGKYDDAIGVLDTVIEMDPNYTDAYTTKGFALLELKRYDEALEAYEQATELNSTKVIAWSGKGDALLKLKRYDEALEAYDKALELDSESWGALSGKSDTLYALGRDEEASELSAKADSIPWK
ncbi:MAG: lipoprotein NlpI [Euryarchaeota archaeon ADurb.Bin294]|nr:MAG: lipoprotein NlpI [Euryarchaeota archaeon ADurb.Bin294]